MSTAHQFGRMALDYNQTDGAVIRDPGDGKQINVDRGFGVCVLTIGSGSETRTLPDPDVGTNGMGIGTQVTIIAGSTDGGSCTVEGVLFTTPGQSVTFQVGIADGTRQWSRSGSGGSIGEGEFTSGQIILPMHSGDGLGGSIKGAGIAKTTLIPSDDVTGEFITSENFGLNDGPVFMEVSDLYLFGNHGIQANPNDSEVGEDDVASAVVLDGVEHYVHDLKIKDFRGEGIKVIWGTSQGSGKVAVPQIRDCTISHCYDGIIAGAVDTQVRGCRISDVRDYGLKDTAGNMQSSNNHMYGCTIAMGFGAFGASVGPSNSTNDVFSDSRIGLDAWNTDSLVTGGFTQRCWQYNIFLGAPTTIVNTVVKVANETAIHTSIVGVEMATTDCAFIGGRVKLGAYEFVGHSGHTAGTGIKLYNRRNRIITTIELNPLYVDEVGLWISSANVHGCDIAITLVGLSAAANIGVHIEALGQNNRIAIFANEGDGTYNTLNNAADKRLLKVAGTHASNVITINGNVIDNTAAYP